MLRRSMLECSLDCLIDASGGFDHYRTGRDLVILGLPLAVKLRGEASVDRAKHRLWGSCRCFARGIQRRDKCQDTDLLGLGCAGLVYFPAQNCALGSSVN